MIPKRFYGSFFLLLVLFSSRTLAAPKGGRTCSPEMRRQLYQAEACFNRSDFGCAKLKAEAILEQEPHCADALYLQGFLDLRDNKIEEGKALQEQAVRLDPHLKDFWEDRAHSIESDALSSQEFSHFVVKFNGGRDRDKAWQAVNHLDEIYGDLGSQFGSYPPRKIEVIIYTTYEFLNAWRAPFIAGFFDKRDGKVRVRLDEVRGGEEEFRRRVRHEFTHAFVRQLYPTDLPVWFQEGVAQFYAYDNANDGLWKENRLEEIRREIKKSYWLNMSQIENAIAKKNVAPVEIYIAYLESEALVLSVAKDRGESWVPSMLRQLQQGATFEAAFQEVVGVTPAVVMEQLRRSWE
jgi:hypothetical protein